ncbi:MAG: c-type cytochrome [Myxococcota bacterium]
MRRCGAVLLALIFACSSAGETIVDFPADGAGGKTDIFGRALVGVAAPYPADPTLAEREETIHASMAERRAMAWAIAERAIEPVPLLGLAERTASDSDEVEADEPIPNVPRFQSWYGVEDLRRMFQHLYENMNRADRLRREPFTADAIEAAEAFNASAVDRSRRWPLERFLRYVEGLGICEEDLSDDECARQLQSNFSGATGGNVRITYAPSTVRHLLENYASILDCMDRLDTLEFGADPVTEDNFTFCYEREMPADAVLIKAQWVRADFGRDIAVYDTDAETLGELLSERNTGTWPEDGNRRADPSDRDIVTIRLRNGDTYRLAGLHVMTKELRHWTWVTLWWSDTPNRDFGEDRPESFDALGSAWANYKMCVVTDYEEGDVDFEGLGEFESLSAALRAQPPGATWCSNPYIEEGRGNARTNCVGCHQHGGSTVGEDLNGDDTLDPFDLVQVIDDEEAYPLNGRTRQRDVFPSDYLWSSSRVDNLFQVMRSEVDRLNVSDGRAIDRRIDALLEAEREGEGDIDAGAEVFAENCARCHGADGSGDFGPDLFDRVPMRDDETLLERVLLGIGPMPAWDQELEDDELTNLFVFLRDRFGAPLE